MFKFVLKPSQPMGPPTYRYLISTHSMQVQTFTTDRGPTTLAMSIASSKSFCPPLIYILYHLVPSRNQNPFSSTIFPLQTSI